MITINKGAVRILPDANTSKIKRKYLDVPYGDESEFQKLDVYLPDTGGGVFPIIVFIHGGAWYAGDKTDMQVQPFLKFINYGYAVVSINYRLSGEATFPAGFQDCKKAVSFLKEQAARYHLDSRRIALSGESAGAYYVLMLIGAKVGVQCALSLFAVTDIENMYEQMKSNGRCGYSQNDRTSPEARHLGGAIADISSERLKAANPIYHIHEDMPPVLLQHGCQDAMVAHQQSVTYYERAREIAGEDKVTLELFKNADHGDSAFAHPQNMKRIKEFFDTYLQ